MDSGAANGASNGGPTAKEKPGKNVEKLDKFSAGDSRSKNAASKPHAVWTLVSGLPGRSLRWTSVTVAINLVLVIFTADMVYRAPLSYPSHDLSFARVGYVSDTSARILVREPDSAKWPLYVSYRGAPSNEDPMPAESWISAEQAYWLSNETDFTYTLTIPQLTPSTRYVYAVSNNHSGFFTTAPPTGETLPVSKCRASTSPSRLPHALTHSR